MIPTSYLVGLKGALKDYVKDSYDVVSATLYVASELFCPLAQDAYESTPLVKQTVKKTIDVAKEYVQVSKRVGGYFAKNAYEATPIPAFAKSVIGRQVVRVAKGALGDMAGRAVGAVAPEAMIGYSAGMHVTGHRAAGVGAALSASVLTKSLTYYTGISLDGFLLTTAGTIAGGYEGRKAVVGISPAKDVLDTYHARSVQNLTARGVVGALRDALPMPGFIAPFTGVVGTAVETVTGLVAGNGRELLNLGVEIYSRDHEEKYFDPGRIVKEFAVGSSSTARNFVVDMTNDVEMVPLALRAIQSIMSSSIDKKSGAKIFVRAINQYGSFIQDPEIAERLRELEKATDPISIKNLKNEVKSLISAKVKNECGILDRVLASASSLITDAHLASMIDMICDTLESTERSMTGFVLSDRQTYRKLLEVHASFILPLIVSHSARIQILSKFSSQYDTELDENEVKAFYSNMTHAIMAPFKGYALTGLFQAVFDRLLPALLESTKVAPVILDKVMEMYFASTSDSKVEEISDDYFKGSVAPKSKSRSFFSFLVNIFGTAFLRIITQIEKSISRVRRRKEAPSVSIQRERRRRHRVQEALRRADQERRERKSTSSS